MYRASWLSRLTSCSQSPNQPSLVNIDFDFFDPKPVDFIAIKRLLSQLFQADAELLHTHELTELIISQPLLGTTVKTDGIDSDPYAFLTVLNMNVLRVNPSSVFLSVKRNDSSQICLRATSQSTLSLNICWTSQPKHLPWRTHFERCSVHHQMHKLA